MVMLPNFSQRQYNTKEKEKNIFRVPSRTPKGVSAFIRIRFVSDSCCIDVCVLIRITRIEYVLVTKKCADALTIAVKTQLFLSL